MDTSVFWDSFCQHGKENYFFLNPKAEIKKIEKRKKLLLWLQNRCLKMKYIFPGSY